MFKPLAFAACVLIAASAHATDLALPTAAAQPGYGAWQQFNVSDIDSLTRGVEWIDFRNTNGAGFGSALVFTFTIGAGEVGTLAVVDGAFAGDIFAVTNFGTSIGSTSAVPATDYASAADFGYDFDAALANAAFSRAVLSFGAGSYRIGGSLVQSVLFDGLPLNATVGAVRLTVAPLVAAVPEPSTWAALLGGLILFGVMSRRRDR